MKIKIILLIAFTASIFACQKSTVDVVNLSFDRQGKHVGTQLRTTDRNQMRNIVMSPLSRIGDDLDSSVSNDIDRLLKNAKFALIDIRGDDGSIKTEIKDKHKKTLITVNETPQDTAITVYTSYPFFGYHLSQITSSPNRPVVVSNFEIEYPSATSSNTQIMREVQLRISAEIEATQGKLNKETPSESRSQLEKQLTLLKLADSRLSSITFFNTTNWLTKINDPEPQEIKRLEYFNKFGNIIIILELTKSLDNPHVEIVRVIEPWGTGVELNFKLVDNEWKLTRTSLY